MCKGFIVGAYPCAPSFHQKGEAEEAEFWRKLAATEHIIGIEQPIVEHLHPFGDDWLLHHTPENWHIVVTAIMGTMQKRGVNNAFGLASTDDEQRLACIAYYKHFLNKINAINKKHSGKITAIEIHAAPNAKDSNVDAATESFAKSMKEIISWDWSCDLVLEHCDAMNKPEPRKGFLPLENVLEVLNSYPISVCVNWARSAIEGRNTKLPLDHTKTLKQAGKLGALMFSGTTLDGPYGQWQDLHAPFAPFCQESLMTANHVKELTECAGETPLKFSGIKLLEINPDADVDHRVSILQDGVALMHQNSTK